MRKGFLFSLGACFLGMSLVQAQDFPSTLPEIKPPAPRATIEFEDGEADGKPGKNLTTLPEAGPPAAKKPKPQLPAPPSTSAKTAVAPEAVQTQQPSDNAGLFAADNQQQSRLWFSTEYLLWWVKNGPVNTPLLATGSLSDAIPGALGQPHTQVLFGNSGMDYGLFSGLRLGAGVNLGDNWGLEGSFFALERRSTGITAASDAAGSPLLGRPFYDTLLGSENTQLTSNPLAGDTWAGKTTIDSHTRLFGFDANVDRFLVNTSSLRVAGLIGFRALDLNEDLSMADTVFPPGTANFTFLGHPISPAATAFDYDKFQTINHFYGGQLGARVGWMRGNVTVSMVAKVALGDNQQQVAINGTSALLSPGIAPVVTPGGLLAQTSNIGNYFRNQFSVVPEAQFNLGWQIRPWLNANVGYTFMYWSDVVRPGEQIDRNVNQSLQPFGALFGKGTSTGPPFFTFQNSDFWAQGINFGLRFSF